MTLAVLPIIVSLRLTRWQAALAVGMIVWIVGGGGSLLAPNTMIAAGLLLLPMGAGTLRMLR